MTPAQMTPNRRRSVSNRPLRIPTSRVHCSTTTLACWSWPETWTSTHMLDPLAWTRVPISPRVALLLPDGVNNEMKQQSQLLWHWPINHYINFRLNWMVWRQQQLLAESDPGLFHVQRVPHLVPAQPASERWRSGRSTGVRGILWPGERHVRRRFWGAAASVS